MITYREFAPAPELAGHVRAYFSFMPEMPKSGHREVLREVVITRTASTPLWTPTFADARTSFVLTLGASYQRAQGWTRGAPLRARVIGPLRRALYQRVDACSEMVGAYLQVGATSAFLDASPYELTDRVADLEEFWGSGSSRLVAHVAEVEEPDRVELLEAALLQRLRPATSWRSGVAVGDLACWVQSDPSSMTVGRVADAAGVSRRHLLRVFRQALGLGPKRFCRIARFHAGLRHAGAGPGVKWAQLALELGYTDQSHMIAEFRELSGLTPESLATGGWFHPFILTTTQTQPGDSAT